MRGQKNKLAGTYIIDDLRADVHRSYGRRLHHRADLRDGHEVRHHIGHSRRLKDGHLVSDCGGLRLLNGLGL